MAHAVLLILLHRWTTGDKNQTHFLLVCSNCQNTWLNECQAVSWRQYFIDGKTIRRSPGSPVSLHFPEMENPPHWSPGRHVAGWTMPADHRHRHHRLVLSSTNMLTLGCSDLSPFSPLVWIPPEELNKFFLEINRQHWLIKPQYLCIYFVNAFQWEKSFLYYSGMLPSGGSRISQVSYLEWVGNTQFKQSIC